MGIVMFTTTKKVPLIYPSLGYKDFLKCILFSILGKQSLIITNHVRTLTKATILSIRCVSSDLPKPSSLLSSMVDDSSFYITLHQQRRM